jgi:hypothetical protein
MKYKVIKSDILLNGKLIPENSEVDLSESEIKGIEDYLSICHSERAQRVEESPISHPELACLPLGTVEGSLDTKKEKESKK